MGCSVDLGRLLARMKIAVIVFSDNIPVPMVTGIMQSTVSWVGEHSQAIPRIIAAHAPCELTKLSSSILAKCVKRMYASLKAFSNVCLSPQLSGRAFLMWLRCSGPKSSDRKWKRCTGRSISSLSLQNLVAAQSKALMRSSRITSSPLVPIGTIPLVTYCANTSDTGLLNFHITCAAASATMGSDGYPAVNP